MTRFLSVVSLVLLALFVVFSLSFISPDLYLAFAQGAESAKPAAPAPSPLMKILPLFFIITIIYYFLVLSPQLKEQKAQKQLLEGLKKGDKVVTTGGIFATLVAVESDHAKIEVDNNVRLKIELTHIKKKL